MKVEEMSIFEKNLIQIINDAGETTEAKEIADTLLKAVVSIVQTYYFNYDELNKSLSDNNWEEWLRNQLEGNIAIAKLMKGIKDFNK